jgi:hypothetical protein
MTVYSINKAKRETHSKLDYSKYVYMFSEIPSLFTGSILLSIVIIFYTVHSTHLKICIDITPKVHEAHSFFL